MKKNTKSKPACENCGSTNLKSLMTSYPVPMLSKQVNVERVPSRECLDCHEIAPTEAGLEKIQRCILAFMG